MLEPEFFGYVSGAFTGAGNKGKDGLLDRANGGTLLIDEIGDIPLTLQGKLLRVLQDQTYERVGDPATIKVDIRFIAATNQDLEEKVSRGTFRKDLYYRLNVIHIPIPPLRKRIEDIKPLVYAFLTKHNEIFGMKVSDINLGALTALQAYDWPGNIRELENVIERALNFAVDDTIKLEN
ncbi:MAG: sigma 54-interacting transcriptional regulator [Bacillota bacterium]